MDHGWKADRLALAFAGVTMAIGVTAGVHAGSTRAAAVDTAGVASTAVRAADGVSGEPMRQGKTLPDGDGQRVIVKMCSDCHGVESAVAQRRTREIWQRVVADMVGRGAPGTHEDEEVAVDYLSRHFGKVDVNTAPADEITATLALPAAQADAIVQYRAQHGKFKTLDDLKKVPELDAKTIDDAKDRIAF